MRGIRQMIRLNVSSLGPFQTVLLMALVNGVLFAWFLAPLLFRGNMVNHTDALLFSYPLVALFGERIGESGLMWNDLSGLGFPSLYVHGFLFQPFLWIALVVADPVDALHFIMFFYPWLGSFMLAQALVRMGYRPLPAWLGSVAFPFVLWGWLFEPTISFFLPLFGAGALAVSVMDTRPRTAAWSMGAVCALGFLSLQSHYAVLLFLSVCLLWIIRRISISKRGFTRADAAFVVALFIAFIVGSFRVVPLLAFASLSTRMGEFLDAYLSTYAISVGYFFRYLWPGSSLPVSESFYANTPYLGIGIVVLAFLGILYGRKRSLTWVALVVWALTISLALPSSPTFHVLGLLPGIAQLGDPTRYLLLGQLALIALAVEGLQRMREISLRTFRIYSSAAFVLAVLLLLPGYAGIYVAGSVPLTVGSVPPPIAVLLEKNAVVFPFLTDRGTAQARDLGETELRFSEQQRSITLSELQYFAAQALGTPNTHLFHGLQNIAMFDHIQPKRLDQLLATLGSGYSHAFTGSGETPPSIEARHRMLRERWHVLRRLGVSHILTPLPLPERSEVMQFSLLPEIRGPNESGALITLLEPISLYVYEVPDARGHLSVASNVVTMPPDSEAAWSRIVEETTNERTIIECRECPGINGGPAELTILAYTPIRTRARIRSETSQWVVVTRQLLPGWRVRIDGERVDTAIADGLLIAAAVPAGDHEIDVAFSFIGMFTDAVELLLTPKRSSWFS